VTRRSKLEILVTPTMDEQRKPAVTGTAFPRHRDNLDISPADDGYIIYQPELDIVHFLNPTALLILELCTGENSPDQIVDLVKEAYGLSDAPVQEVHETLKQLRKDSLLS
jgi:hypothetical protein